MRGILFIPPLLQLIIFGYAVSFDVNNARIAWMDLDRTPQSRALLARFEGSGRFEVTALPTSEADVQSLLEHGSVHGVVRVLPGFAKSITRHQTTDVQVLLDGTNSNTASLISGYAAGVINAYARDLRHDPPSPVTAETRIWFNPDLVSRNYFVPGVVVNILLVVTMSLTAQAIIREKELGTMEQLMVTPMRPIELIIGKTLPFAAIGLIDLVVVTGASLLIFRVPFRGSFLFLMICSVLFLMTTLGAGLLLSTISQTQQQANMGSFFFSLPAFMLSGFTFPISNMPVAVQYLTYLNPMRYFMEIVRGVFLKGVGVSILWPQMLCLFIYGTLILSLSVIRFKKNID
jgi:ABC-2 type transport system permease protein